MNKYLPFTLCLILATSFILFMPIQVFAITTTFQYKPDLPISPFLVGNGSGSFLLTNFHFSQFSNASFVNVNASLASIDGSGTFRTEKDYVYLNYNYTLTLNDVSASWGSKDNIYNLRIHSLNLKGQAYVNGNSTTITSSATTPLYSFIGSILKVY